VGKPQTELDPFRDELRGLREALGNRIPDLRKRKGWSQEVVFAAKAHVHRTFEGSLERGEKNISFHALVLIARCFEMRYRNCIAGQEAGKPTRARDKRKSRAGIDRDRLLSEVAALEANIRVLRELAAPGEERRGIGTETETPATPTLIGEAHWQPGRGQRIVGTELFGTWEEEPDARHGVRPGGDAEDASVGVGEEGGGEVLK
jgi:transcriptional regulator with XRE-family HTH domain